MESIFKALSDNTRRTLLDSLRKQDGQTLTGLGSTCGLSRFGVMKHLKQLEDANLIVTRKVGRFKYHYLNAAPLQLLIDRWIEPMTRQPLTRALLDLKADLERNDTMTNDAKPDFMLETYIKCSPQKLWDAMCSPEMTARYNVAGGAIQGKLEAGSAYKYMNSSGFVTLTGEIIAADPPHRLEMTFVPGWLGAHAKQSRNIYEIEAVGDVTKLTILHYGLTDELEDVRRGWSKMAASLKSLIETGEELKFV